VQEKPRKKKNRTPGPDGITADVYTSAQMLYEVYKNVWENETFPVDWKEGDLVKIPQKGNLADCSNYRGITIYAFFPRQDS